VQFALYVVLCQESTVQRIAYFADIFSMTVIVSFSRLQDIILWLWRWYRRTD